MAELFHQGEGSKGVLILHGGSAGVESAFVQEVFEQASNRGLTALAYDFPFRRDGGGAPSEDYIEEIPTVLVALQRLNESGAGEIHVVAKSIGSAIMSEALRTAPQPSVNKVTIMGLPLGITQLDHFHSVQLQIVQGEFDRFGNLEAVQKALSETGISNAHLSEIKGATHSFRDRETDSRPIFEQDAVAKIEF